MEVGIALDGMGGDFLAVPNIQGSYGALRIAEQDGRALKVYLCGPEDRLEAAVSEAVRDPQVPDEFKMSEERYRSWIRAGKIVVVPSKDWVEMDESPAVALRTRKESSLAKSFELVREGKAGAMISAGNSGAVMAFGIAMLKRMNNVRRPAILCNFPSKTGVTALLDAGANVDCTVEQLTQFALMGLIYYQTAFDKVGARVALLNIGEEEGKGNEVVKATHEILKSQMPQNYIGFVEGRDIMLGKADVIVCDGFVGNVALKTAEGVVKVIKETLKDEFNKNPIWGIGAWLAKGGFSAMKTKLDYREYGAAPLVGLDGLGLVAHGSSDGKAIQNAVLAAEKFVRQGLMDKLRRGFEAFEAKAKAETLNPAGVASSADVSTGGGS